tara:strand:+ start:153 stop:488 length:336 start_codon:yes stop_codon:yes gene_type:complete
MATFSYDPSFSATETSQPLVRTVVMGDAYEQRIQLGLQRDPKTWRLSFNNRDDTERDNILSFLEARKGTESFDWTPPRGSAGKYVCSDWNVDIALAGRTTITTTFREVFEP